jgi:hypothetical protein
MEGPEYGDGSMRETFLAALKDVGVDLKLGCPHCGGMNWATGNRTLLFPTIEITGKLSSPEGHRGFEVGMIWCERCGYLRLHALQALMQD